MTIALALLVLLAMPVVAGAAELPIVDAHIHYSHDAVDVLPPKEAAAILRKAGVKRALVPVGDTRAVGKADMPLNDAMPRIEVEADTFEVRIDGQVIEPEPVDVLPMAQRYFLF